MQKVTNSKELPPEEVAVRSLLMRLYHSHADGEAFYPAGLVNGHASQLEADGWIEWHEQGWRITQTGISQWAEMNRQMLELPENNRNYLHGGRWHELKSKIHIEGRDIVGTCKKEGCNKPRHVSIGGNEFTYCHEHQKEQWAAAKREKSQATQVPKPSRQRETRTVEQIKTVGQFVDGEPSHSLDALAYATEERQRMQIREVATVTVMKQPPAEAVHDCDQCSAKAVVEALRAKSPKLAKLIDAMQAEVEAAAELGL